MNPLPPFVSLPPVVSAAASCHFSYPPAQPPPPPYSAAPFTTAHFSPTHFAPSHFNTSPLTPTQLHHQPPLPSPPVSNRRVKGKPRQRFNSNAKERRRNTNINSAFHDLQKRIPHAPKPLETTLPKIKTLRLAISYIRELQTLVRDDSADLDTLERRFAPAVAAELQARNSYKERAQHLLDQDLHGCPRPTSSPIFHSTSPTSSNCSNSNSNSTPAPFSAYPFFL